MAALLCLAACADAPSKVSAPAFTDTKLLETTLHKGVSSAADVRRALGEPTGTGALYLPRLSRQPYDVLFYQDIALTDMKGASGELHVSVRQQILVVYIRDGVYEGFTWFSNTDQTTAWVRDPLRGKVAQ